MTGHRWGRRELRQHVQVAFDLAGDLLDRLPATSGDGVVPPGKIVAEAAMLLYSARGIEDDQLRAQGAVLATALAPRARDGEAVAGLCLDPGQARDHAIAHILLTRLGFGDEPFDRLLNRSLADAGDLGPERLAHRDLEQHWLESVRTGQWLMPPELVATSSLGRHRDVLGSATFDDYAFTHALLYASDFGAQPPVVAVDAVTADAEALLAASLDGGNLDLSAELLWAWPMLNQPWSNIAGYAFGRLDSACQRYGFLPGRKFDAEVYEGLAGDAAQTYRLDTSYHSTFVFGFLCAAAITSGRLPERKIDATAAGSELRPLVGDGLVDAPAELMLATILRRGRAGSDFALIQAGLEIALRHDLIDGPGVAQAAALLRRIASSAR